MNLDLSGKMKRKDQDDYYDKVYSRTSNSSNHLNLQKRIMRTSTPEYNFKVNSYKSRLWANKDSSNKTIDNHLKKSFELNNRVRMKEMNVGKRSQSLQKDNEEMNEMLIDSILYKVKYLQEL